MFSKDIYLSFFFHIYKSLILKLLWAFVKQAKNVFLLFGQLTLMVGYLFYYALILALAKLETNKFKRKDK